MLRIFSFSLFLLILAPARGQENSSFRPVHKDVLESLYEIDLEGTEKIFQERKEELAYSPVTMLLENYYDFLLIQLRDEYPLYKELKKSKNNRIGYIQNLKTGDPDWLRYCQAQIHLQWGMARIKLEFYSRGIWDTRLGFQQLEALENERPNFLPAKMSFGLLETMLGVVPKGRGKWMKLIGMEGDIFKGLEDLEASTSRENPFWYESEMLLAYCEGYLLNQEKEGIERLQRLNNEKSSLFLDFIQAIYLMKVRENQKALRIINDRIDSCPEIINPHFHFLLGDALLRKGLYEDAIYHLKYFLFHYKGMSMRKEANYKVSIAYYLDGNVEKAKDYWVRTARLGYTFLASDHYAQKEFELGLFPNKTLYRARMYFDGGYYKDAKKELSKFVNQKQTTRQLASEYYYRKGRVDQAEGNLNLALENYRKSIEHQAEDQWYFAPNAWLQSGYIYAGQGQKEKARNAYQMATEYPKNPYQESIDSKAKVGLLLLDRPASANDASR